MKPKKKAHSEEWLAVLTSEGKFKQFMGSLVACPDRDCFKYYTDLSEKIVKVRISVIP